MKTKLVGLLIFCCLWATASLAQIQAPPCPAQSPGFIVQPATTSVMNPHGNGWVTSVPNNVPPIQCGFDTTAANYKLNCINQFEFTMYGIPEIGTGDVLKDNIGAACGITDLIPDKKGYSVYTLRDGGDNLIFRFRLGNLNSSVEAYSILIDTDQKFGKAGDPGVTAANADPNWTPGNPGFEIDITLINNSNGNSGGVFTYDIDGIDSCPTPLTPSPYSYDSHVQISRADTHTCNDNDYFIDYYVPLTGIIAAFNAHKNSVTPARTYDLAVTTGLRYAALTNQNAGCSMQGKISDISGVDNSTATYSTSSSTGIYNSFVALVNSQCGTPLNDLLSGAGGFDKNVVTKPTINPVNILQTVISGTTVESGIYIKVEVFPQTSPTTWASTPIETEEVTEAAGVTNWSVTLTRPLAGFDLVVATTQKDKFTVPCANNGANNSSSTAVVVTCLLEATLNPTNVSCNGGADGTITSVISAAPNNGNSPYTYLWSNGQATPNATNLSPGTYSLILKDVNGCQAILNPVTITQPTALTASVAFTNVTCNGANDATITIGSPTGGHGTYEYSINGGTNWQSSGSFTGLSNSSYNVLIRDAAHTSCVVDLDGAGNTTITQPSTLSATVASTNVTCNGSNDGTITVSSPIGGYGTYQYSINGGATWQSSGSFTGLPNGTYNVLISDAAHSSCAKDLDGLGNTTITQPVVLSASVTSTNVTSFGANNGTITISSPAGGYGTFQYSIDGGATWQSTGSYTGLPSGTYNVQIRDAAHTNCVIDLDGATNTTILQPSGPITATVSVTNVTCNGASDGTITINSASGGYGTYQYSIDGGTSWQSSGSFTGLPAASTYNVLIRDAAYPTDVVDLDGAGTTTISQPAVLSATISSTNATVFGVNNGTITISSPSGGSGSYQYSINGGGSWQSSGSFTGLPGGTYNVLIRDAAHNTCIIDLDGVTNTTILQPTAPLTAIVTSTNVTCNGASDGTITISSPSGGFGTYEYSINGGGTWQSSGVFGALPNGSYNVFIRDAVSTSDVIDLDGTTNTLISQPSVLSATISKTNITANGASDGTITISLPSGGYGTYEYSINGGGSWQSSGSFTGLANATYDVKIRDAAHTSCSVDLDGSTNTPITQPAVLTATINSTNVTCNGASDGTITVTSPNGGYGTYEYSINGGGTWQSSGSFTGLANATYDVWIRDAAHMADAVDLDGTGTVITQQAALTATVNHTNVLSFGANDGTITITSPSGGYGTYEYSINSGGNWQSSGTFTGLSNGIYNVWIRDAAHIGCIVDLDGSTNTTLTQPAPLSADVTTTNVTCNGANDGTITISNPLGGSLSYEYSIHGVGGPWLPSGTFTGLANGTYDIQIRDAVTPSDVVDLDGTINTLLTQPAVLSATVSSTNVSSNGGTDGTITISNPTGGYGTFEYSIDDGTSWHSSGLFTGLSSATYNLLIRDAAHPLCKADLDGAVGTPIIQPTNPLTASVSSTNITCNGSSDGTISISAAGGYGTYEYSINGGTTWQSSVSFTNLAIGIYDVKVRDAAYPTDIIDKGNTTITQPLSLSATITTTNVSTVGGSDGKITITSAAGGSGTYEYSIGGAWQSTATFSGLSANSYDVHIRDAAHHLCEIDLDGSVNTTIIQPTNPLSAIVSKTNVTCNSAADGTITISSPTGGFGTYQYSINGGGTWQSSGSFTGLAASTGYDVQIRDAAFPADVKDLDGSSNTTISQPLVLGATVSSTNATSNGANDATITISTPTGGYGTFEYSINGGTNWQSSGSFTGLSNGTYNILIRDAAHTTCIADLDGGGNTPITQPPVLSATLTSNNITCNGSSDGKITISSPLGGYGTYEYSINGGGSWQSTGAYTNLPPSNSYNVLIRDAAHTTDIVDLDGTTNTTISQPAVLSATVSSTNITGNGANDGTITISSPSGGYGTFEYSIDGTTWQSSGSYTGLSVGTYNILIRDAAHITCITDLNGSLNTPISQPAVLSASVSSTNVTCNGASDGTINISTPSGGYGTYEYNIGGTWQSSGLFTGLPNGTYDVHIRDAAHPTDVVDLGTTNSIISQPNALTASVAFTNVTRNNGNDGTITVSSPSGGSGTFQYSVNGTTWQSSGLFTGLSNGTYSVQIRDAAHTSCSVDLDGSGNTILIQPSSPLTATVSTTSVTCNGSSDGSITISSPAGGYGTFEFSINGGVSWQSSGSFTNLAGGSYNVQIRDAVYTTDVVDLDGSTNTTVPQPAVLSAIVTFTNVTAYNANDGTITISFPIGGFGTYEFSIDGGITWQSSDTFTGLAPATTYNVFIRDAAHTSCLIDLDGSINTTIIQPTSPLSALVSTTSVSCNGSADGTITISSPAGGYGTYEYSIDGGTTWQSSGVFASVTAASTYNVLIRDAAYPTDVVDLDGTSNTTISQPAVLSATITSKNVSTIGASDGTITISSPAGGNGTYEYSIDGGTNWQSSGAFTGLAPASTYNVLIRDAAHTSCVIDLDGSVNTTIIQPGTPLSATVTATNTSCNGTNDGTITVSSPAGGYGTYEYSIDGGTTWQSSGSFTGLAPASTYNVLIRDAAYPADVVDLDGSGNTTTIQSSAVLTATISPQNVTCNGANDGSITINSSSGGGGTYDYSIDGGTTWQSSGLFTGLAAASTYNLQIRDAAHTACVVDLDGAVNTSITQPNALTATVTFTNVTANGANDGTITITAPAGGYGSYQYSIDGGTTWQSSGSFTGLTNAIYNVQIRDAAHASCTADLDGSVNTTIIQPGTPLSATVTATNTSCNGTNDGTITVSSPAGGYGTYEYSIDGGTTWQSSGSFTALSNATFNVQIRDAAFPTDVVDLDGSANTAITQPVALSGIISSTKVTTMGGSDGTITINSSTGGNGTYEYSIDGGTNWQASNTFTGLLSGTYNVLIRDAAHTTCTVDLDGSVDTVIIQPTGPLTATVTVTNTSCNGTNDGTITISSPAGGYGTYEYSINGGTNWQASGTFTGLAAATTYDVQIRDAAQTSDVIDLDGTGNTVITQPTILTAAVNFTNDSCNGANDGTITINSASGGYGTYEFSVNGGQTWQAGLTFTSLSTGTYNVQVRDGAHASCIVDLDGTANTTIAGPSAVSGSGVVTPVGCAFSNSGAIDLSVSGGTLPYTFAWSNSAASEDVTELIENTYTVTITDFNNCTLNLSFDVPLECRFRIYQGVSPNGDGKNDYWRIDKIEEYPANTVRIFDRFNNLVYETSGYTNESNNWVGQSNHGLTRGVLPEDTYFYWVDLGRGNGTYSGYLVLKNH